MKSIFGLNYFAFCFIVLALVLIFTKDMRDEGFGMSPGTLTQLQSTSSRCSSLPPMSTSMMNPMSSPLGDLIQRNLTEQGIINMTEVPKKDPGFYALI